MSIWYSMFANRF